MESTKNESVPAESRAALDQSRKLAAIVGDDTNPAGLFPPRRDVKSSAVPLGVGDRLAFYLMLAFIHALSLVPDFVLLRLGAFCGLLGYWLDRRHVEIGKRNLAIAFPEKDAAARAKILRASYVNLGTMGAEYVRLGGFFYRRLIERVTYGPLGAWRAMLERKNSARGVVILTAHTGNFELLPSAHAGHGLQIALVHHTQRFLAGDALMTWIRERAGVEILRKHSAARAVLKALRDGELIGIPFDQNAKRSEAVWVPFFGEPAATSSGLARLTRMSQAPVVPVFIVRQPDLRSHKIVILDEIPQQRTADAEADVIANTARFVKAVEDFVRQYPEQFLWTHRRYRTRPRGMMPIYEPKKKSRAKATPARAQA